MRNILRAFIKKELVQALRDPRMKFMLFVTPVVQLIIFGLALNSDVKNIQLYARPMANDVLLTDIRRDALAGGWFVKSGSSEAMAAEDIKKFINGRTDLALYTPEGGLTEQFERGYGHLEAVIDGADLIRARGIYGYLGNIVSRVVDERLGRTDTYDFMRESGDVPQDVVVQPIEFAVRILYNPELETSYNLVPGVVCMLICVITIMLTSMSIAKEKEIGTFETLVSAPVSVTEILLGKTIPYIIIGCVNLPFVFFIAVACFDVPMRGSYFFLALATFFFVVSTVAIGTMISTICRNQQQAMMGGFIFILPAILISGTIFPVDNLPLSLKILSYLDPLMYFNILLRNIMLKGGDPFILASYIGALFLIAAVSTAMAFKKFKLHLG
jgi:ABC-2 type transport system permease protein